MKKKTNEKILICFQENEKKNSKKSKKIFKKIHYLNQKMGKIIFFVIKKYHNSLNEVINNSVTPKIV